MRQSDTNFDDTPPVPGCDRNCITCKACVLFQPGDSVELNPAGILAIGRRLVRRGKLLRFERLRERIVAVVHWDDMPSHIDGKLNPLYLQHVLANNRLFM